MGGKNSKNQGKPKKQEKQKNDFDLNTPIIVWIDKKVNNKANKKYKNYITKNIKYRIFSFDSVTIAIDLLKKIEFIKTYIICSGLAYLEYIQLFKKNLNEFMISPQTIIFTSNKQAYIDRNFDNKDLYLEDPFYNWGGVEDKFKEIIKFLKNEKMNEMSHKSNDLILKLLKTEQINDYHNNDDDDNDIGYDDINIGMDNDIDIDKEADKIMDKYFANVKVDLPKVNTSDKINTINIKISEIDNINKQKSSFDNEIENDIKESLDFPFPNNNSQNDEISNIKNDELNPFRNENVKPKKIEIEVEDKKRYADDSTQYNFEFIEDKVQLILPIYLSFYIKKPVIEQINKFNKYMQIKYSNEKKLVKLFEQLDKRFNIPNEIISKYWVRAYTAESNFYKDMNKNLRLNKIAKYLPFIHMMYEGIKIKSFNYKPSNKLYRGAYFDQKEISLLEYHTKHKKPDLPGSIIYSKSFLSFSMDKKIAMKFKKNVVLIIEEFLEDSIKCSGCAAIKKFSFIKREEEILVFPFSAFEVKQIKKVEEKEPKKNYYIIFLNYLGKYEKFFKGYNPVDLIEDIPHNSLLAQEIFKTDIIDDKYKNIFFRKGEHFDCNQFMNQLGQLDDNEEFIEYNNLNDDDDDIIKNILNNENKNMKNKF